MVIQFKKAIFLNFGYTQTIESLWRMATQIEQHWEKRTTQQALLALSNTVDFLPDHRSKQVQSLYEVIKPLLPIKSIEDLSRFAMQLERILGKELKDPDFLISTKDTLSGKGKQQPVVLILDNLRSAYNVGSLFRTAEALGVKHIYLCGLTPTPDNTKTSRTALGSDQWIEWSYFESTSDCLDKLKVQNIQVYALETAENAKNIENFSPASPCAILLGNERYGVPSHLLALCDEIISIPMNGRKNSLNVGVCGGIALHNIIKNLS